MMRALIPLAALSACALGWAQTPDSPEFEVASFKVSPPHGAAFTVMCNGGPGSKDPGLFTCTNMSITNLVARAYHVPYYRITAPDWMGQAMFEISAKVPPETAKDQFDLMLQRLLTERIKLAVHHESKELAKYDLVVAKAGKLKPSAPPPPTTDTPPGASKASPGPQRPRLDKDGFPILEGRGMVMMNGRARTYQPDSTMEMLASMLSAQLGKPVTDATGLTGKYEISLFWEADNGRVAPPGGAAPETEPGPTLAQAIQDQLGLRLESKKGPVDFLVIDHAEKVPVEN